MTDKYRGWIEAVAAQFGGLDLCALEVLVARDGREIIMELNDCALPLLGDSQEEDRRLISELVLHRMNVSHVLPFFLFFFSLPFLPKGAGEISIRRQQDIVNFFPFFFRFLFILFLLFFFAQFVLKKNEESMHSIIE